MRRLLPLLVVLLAACAAPAPAPAPGPVPEVDAGVLPQRAVGPPPTMRLADGLVPPTNTWFAGLVFGPEPLPVFPMPLSVDVRDTGFTAGLPLVRATARTVFGSHTPAPDVDLGSAATQVVAYDALTVTTAFLDGDGAERGRMLMSRGSPYVRYTATAGHDLTVTAPELTERDGWWSSPIRETEWGFAGDLDAAGRASLAPGESLTLWAVPPDGDAAELAASAGAAVTGGSATPRVEDDRVGTTLRWDTADGTPPLVAAMPGQAAQGCTAGEYRTAYGPMPLCRGPELTVTAPRIAPAGELDLGGLDGADRDEVAAAVTRDAATALGFTAADTYFGGKRLARAATLLRLAEQLGLDDVAATLRTGVAAQLRLWTEPDGCATRATRCFVYDPVVRGVVGLEASFGSEEFNDHQFHYGYFLYAAAVAARDDPALAADIAPVLDLLAADIAAAPGGTAFPAHRSFDAYAGHSWASGFSPFGDGNNQESSSESVNAYNGLALWAQVRGDDALRERAEWMLGSEAASARRYWTDPPLGGAELDGFDHGVLGINWGGKRDYATWFSPEPSAMLGIQLIPMGPVAGYLAGDPDRIRANIAEATPTGGVDVLFGDYLVMYLALADPAAARAALRELPEERIDDGNSRAYLLAWTYTR